VLPSIRKHGAYITKEKAKDFINSLDTIISLLNTIKEKDDENECLQNKIEDDKPKVAFADALAASQCSIPIGDFAKILQSNGIDIGPNHLFERLRETGLLIKRKCTDRNSPTQKSMKLELFSINESTTLHPDGGITLSRSTKITPKGSGILLISFLTNEEERKKEQKTPLIKCVSTSLFSAERRKKCSKLTSVWTRNFWKIIETKRKEIIWARRCWETSVRGKFNYNT
jgi:anti-repressor protein